MLPTQHWNPAQYEAHARFVSDLGMPVIDLLAPKPGENILDVGCGDGALTIKLAELGCNVTGADASPEMVTVARSRGLNAVVMDAQSLQFSQQFDAVFSNAALHWMKKPEQVIAGVWRALKPGGRFVGEFGGFGNVASIVFALETALSARGIAVENPWYFPRQEEYRRLLDAAGFRIAAIDTFPRPTVLPGSISEWLETFAQPYTSALPIGKKQDFIAEIAAALCPVLCGINGDWTVDYVRLRFHATKPDTVIQ